jgi:hypothetical protein
MGREVDGSGELQQVEEELQQVDAVAWNELHRKQASMHQGSAGIETLAPRNTCASKHLRQLPPLAPINIYTVA